MISARIKQCQDHLQTLLARYLPNDCEPLPYAPIQLYAAMRYACLNGGKRLRPLLVYTTAEIFHTPSQTLDPLAAAIELIHCYSLVHDDLPAMDNDDLRRGLPTCHKVYGEAIALLAGDALLTLAFDILTTNETHLQIEPHTLILILKTLTRAAGANTGMIQGQALDMHAEGKTLTIEALTHMHLAKTGALIAASVQCAGLAVGALQNDLDNLEKYGQNIGLAFQIQDDILDALGDSNQMGKNPKQDVKKNKCTFVTLLGLEAARRYAEHYYMEALTCLDRFGPEAETLRALSAYMIKRVA